MDLCVALGPLRLKNPIVTASGTFGYGEEFEPFYDPSKLGAITVKAITLEPRAGNAPPRLVETPSGLLNAIGLQNPGLEGFIRDKLPYLRGLDTVVIANVAGNHVEDYVKVISRLDEEGGLDAYELNVSCPNVDRGMLFGSDPLLLAELVVAVRRITSTPLIVKLSPNVTDIVLMAKAAAEHGADILSAINTLLGMAVDARRRRPSLTNVYGGLSGPAVKPVALRIVHQLHSAVDLPILAMGGVASGMDAAEFMFVGASAVAVGTANFRDPHAAIEVLAELERFAEEQGYERVGEMIGALER